MKKQELTIKLINELSKQYPNEINHVEIRPLIEKILYDYDIVEKETSLALIDNMSDRIMLYLATKRTEGLAKKTIKSYGRSLIRFANKTRIDVEDVSAMDIRMYLYNYSETGVKASTVAHHTDVLRGFFNWLEYEGYIEKSPAKKINSPKIEKRVRKALTKKEFETLRTGAKTLRQKALLELLYSTGCRLDEVSSMKKRDIDWQNLQIKVVGKGNKERVVYINATCQVHLERYFDSRKDNSDSVIATIRKPIKNLGTRGIQKEIDKIAAQSGIEINIFPHLIRHTTATHLLSSGMSLEVLQRILGHEDSATTLIYAEIDNSKIENEYRRFS